MIGITVFPDRALLAAGPAGEVLGLGHGRDPSAPSAARPALSRGRPAGACSEGPREERRMRRDQAGPAFETGRFGNGSEHATWGAGPRTLLFLPGGPGSAVPHGTTARACIRICPRTRCCARA